LGPAEAEHGRVVPTWNYVAAHVCGALRFADDPALLPRHLRELTARREAGREHPRAAGAAPAEYISQLERAVVGLEVAITRI
jgi:transcriptional regulator